MIIKVKNKPGFAQIQNPTLRDKKLTLEARGALGEILSYSEDFEVTPENLMALWIITREKLLKITNNLKENGYLEIKPIHDKTGKIIDKEWIFYGESQGVNFRLSKKLREHHHTENPDDGKNHHTEKPYDGKNHITVNPDDHLKENKDLKDLKTHTHNPPARARKSSSDLPNGLSSNKTVIPASEISEAEKIPDKVVYAKPIWRYIEAQRMDTPFENPNWQNAIDFAYKRGFTAEEFTGTIHYLKTDPSQEWRKGRITAEIVTNNLQVYFDLKQKNQTQNQPPVSQISQCSECDVRGMREVEIDNVKRMVRCQHTGLKK